MTRSSEMMPHQLRTADRAHVAGEDMFLISMDAVDLTPPLGMVYDGLRGDTGQVMETRSASANWSFNDRESNIVGFEFGLGSVPGCDNVAGFRSVSRADSITLLVDLNEMPELERGRWYFSSVRAKNSLELSNTVSSNGFFVLLPDGGPAVRPNRPTAADPCPGSQPDGGTDGGAGQHDGGTGEQQSPLGWSCGCGATGGPGGFLLLMLVALGLRAARRAD
jgi:MYXO-CTERM domain-containing protein